MADRAVLPYCHMAVGGLGVLGKRSYYRVYCCDCSEEGVIDKLRDMFDKVFHNMSMRVVVETKFEEDSQVAETVASLREEFVFLHFATE